MQAQPADKIAALGHESVRYDHSGSGDSEAHAVHGSLYEQAFASISTRPILAIDLRADGASCRGRSRFIELARWKKLVDSNRMGDAAARRYQRKPTTDNDTRSCPA